MSLPIICVVCPFLIKHYFTKLLVPHSIFFVLDNLDCSLMTSNTAGLQFYLGLPFLLLVRVMKRQMIGKLIMIV